MRFHVPPLRSFLAGFAAMGVICVIVLTAHDALAQSAAQRVQENIARNVAIIPKFIAVLGYVLGVFLTAAGLLKLKDHIMDGSRNPLNPALFRLVVGTLLIYFMHVAIVVNSTMFAEGNNNTGTITRRVPAPDLNVFTKQ